MDKEHIISPMEKIDIQVISVEACEINDVKKSFASLVDSDDLGLDPDLMYARFIMCHEGSNANGDTFTNDVLFRSQHTPRYKPIDWEHGQPMIGTILDSRYAEDAEGRGYIEAIGVIWKFIYPEIAEQIKAKSANGGLKLSMECYFKDANYKYGEQIFDQEQANELGITDYVGKEYMGSKVYRVFKDVIFGGVGVVENPADKEAVFLAVAKKQAEDAMQANEVVNSLSDEQVKAIAQIIRSTNDFTTKIVEKETIDAVTVAKFVKAFDKAKSDIISKFNKDVIATKEQLISEVREVIELLLSSVSTINNDFYTGFASEDSDDSISIVELKLCEQCLNNHEHQKNEGGITMTQNQNNEEVVPAQVENQEVQNQEAQAPNETVNTPVVDEAKVDEANKGIDYQAKASELENKVTELQNELNSKDNEFKSLKSDFEEMKNKVEAGEREKVTNTRMNELTQLGIEFSEARRDKETEKISTMTDEQFTDYKDFLSEIAGKKEEELAPGETPEAVEPKDNEEEVKVEVENTEKSSANLNVETEQPKDIKPFGHLSE